MLKQLQDPYDFQVFDAYNHFNGSGIPEASTPVSLHKATAPAIIDGTEVGSEGNGDQARQGSNSDDEDMTPAQARRKAQNRAAYVSQLLKASFWSVTNPRPIASEPFANGKNDTLKNPKHKSQP